MFLLFLSLEKEVLFDWKVLKLVRFDVLEDVDFLWWLDFAFSLVTDSSPVNIEFFILLNLGDRGLLKLN